MYLFLFHPNAFELSPFRLFWLQLIALVDLILFETAGDPFGQALGGNRRSLHVS